MNNQKIHSHLEFFEVCNRTACTSNVITTSRIKGPLTEEIIRQALELVQQRHPCLNYQIVGSLDQLKLETSRVTKIPLRVVRGFRSDQWQNVVSEETNKKIDSSQALLRAVLFYPENETDISYLITTVHHGIADAMANIRLHQDILTYCQSVTSGNSSEVSSLPILPPIEELMPKSVKGFRGYLNRLLYILRFGLKGTLHRPRTLDFEECIPLKLRSSRFVQKQLDEKFIKALDDACKRENVSQHSAICAAMMFSVARKIESDKNASVPMSCGTSVSLRKSLEPTVSMEYIGHFSSAVTSYHTLGPRVSFWDLARELKQQLQNGLLNEDPFNQLSMTTKEIAKKISVDSAKSFWTVVFGSLKANIPESYGNFELEEINMTAASRSYGATFAGGAIAFKQKLFLSFFYAEPSISRETMESLADGVVFHLSEACKKNPEPAFV